MLLGVLPPDLDEAAKRTGALLRKREIAGGEDLLRLALVYGMDDMSLRETSAWAKEHQIAKLSDVAVLKRLRLSPGFLRYVCSSLLEPVGLVGQGLRLVLVDATTVCRQRAKEPDFRVHLSYSATQARIVGVQLTRSDEGERLDRLPSSQGDVLVADMGYQGRGSMSEVASRGSYFVVRMYPTSIPLEDASGTRVDPFELARDLGVGEVLDLPLRTIASKGIPCVSGRLVVVRKPDKAVEEFLDRKRGKQGPVGAQARVAARYVMLFTNLPQELADAGRALSVYKLRWQVEMAFKRAKGVVSLGETLARDMDLCECKILAKLAILLLVQKLGQDFSPWGYPLGTPQLIPSAKRRI